MAILDMMALIQDKGEGFTNNKLNPSRYGGGKIYEFSDEI